MTRVRFWLHAPLLPLLVLQGRRTRARIPRLPEASGERRASFGAHGAPYRLAVLGESTAVGVGASTQHDALAFALARALAERRRTSIAVQAVGRSGANITTVRRELIDRLELPVDATLVVLGVNDTLELTRGATWSRALRALIGDLRSRGAGTIVFTGVPPLGALPSLPQPTRSALGARAAYLDGLLAQMCAAERVHHRPTRLPRDAALIARDGFHPSARGYAAWANALCDGWPSMT